MMLLMMMVMSLWHDDGNDGGADLITVMRVVMPLMVMVATGVLETASIGERSRKCCKWLFQSF